MATETKEKPSIPPKPARPDGFWSLPGGADGMRGSISGVLADIDALKDVPVRAKDAIKLQIAAATEGTDFNYIRICARAVVNKMESRHHIVGHFDIEVSKQSL